MRRRVVFPVAMYMGCKYRRITPVNINPIVRAAPVVVVVVPPVKVVMMPAPVVAVPVVVFRPVIGVVAAVIDGHAIAANIIRIASDGQNIGAYSSCVRPPVSSGQ